VRPPSRLPLAQWAEANVRLDHTSYVQGKLSLEFYPHLRASPVARGADLI